MAISRDEVLHVARLARLSFAPEEVDKFRDQLARILDYIRQLEALDTRDVVPTSHAVDMGTPFRDDAVVPFGDPGEILKNAPDREGDFFRVPRILED